jgi:hypothetical protein
MKRSFQYTLGSKRYFFNTCWNA